MAIPIHILTLRGTSNWLAASPTSAYYTYAQPPNVQSERTTRIQEIEPDQARDFSNGHHLDEAGHHIPASRKRTRCLYCNAELLKRALPRHIRSTHQRERSVHHCSICGKSFVRKDSFERHLKEQHNDVKTKCDRCGVGVGLRALKGHQQTEKCKYAGVASMQSSRESTSDSGTSKLHRQLDLRPVLDPLVTIASFHRLVLCAWMRSNPFFKSDEFTQAVSFDFESSNQCNEVYKPSKTRSNALDVSDCPHIWAVRSLALAQTREMLSLRRKQNSASLDPESVDDSITQVLLLHSADQTLFGKSSSEAQLHTQGLITLLTSVTPTHRFGHRFEELLEHAWPSVGGLNDLVDQLRSKPLIAILTYEKLLAHKFWYNPEDGRWMVYDLRQPSTSDLVECE
jgi:hypothetical protein